MLGFVALEDLPMSNVRMSLSVLFLYLAGLHFMLDVLNQPTKACGEDKKVAAEPKAGEEREFEIVDGVKMKFCWIPAGKATLGSPNEEKHHDPSEKEHEYVTKGYWLGKYPVTQSEWKAVMGDNPSFFDGKKDNKAKGIDTSSFPLEKVSWDDCQKFLEKLNKRTEVEKVFGKAGQFVLPHEDQWEYACRGGRGNKQAFYFGNELNGTQANCNGNFPYGTDKKGDFKDRTTEVGSYAKDWPHPWGLCDMHGNVWQWCNNKYEQSNVRMFRGGSWYDIAGFCRSAFRNRFEPNGRYSFLGFRVSLPLE
jgi:formylglycine-generating enzyme